MDWKTATTDEKLARMEQRLAEIETAKQVLDEFASVTRVWLKKVQATMQADKPASPTAQ